MCLTDETWLADVHVNRKKEYREASVLRFLDEYEIDVDFIVLCCTDEEQYVQACKRSFPTMVLC